jgi:hypothetical protein
MLCRNCGKSILDTASFCSFCGLQQLVEPSSQPASADTSVHSAPDSALEASDVTVILPRRRANALAAAPPHRDEGASSASTASKDVYDPSAKPRSRALALKIGGAAAIVIIAVAVAAAFYASRSAAPKGKAEGSPASATAPMPAATPSPMVHRDEPVGASAKPETPSIPPMEAATTVDKAPVSEAIDAPEATPQVPANRTVALPKDAAQRRKGRPPPAAVAEPAPVDTPPPQPVAIAPPAPAPAPASAPAEPAKSERIACADSSNPFSRELCLWQECVKPEYRSHAECARFTGGGGPR